MSIKRYALVTTALTGLMLASSAFAQDAGPSATPQSSNGSKAPDPGTVSEVVVNGIRSSIGNSIKLKRDNDSQIDVITAEDVARFPDVNVAEALSRLPGVTIDHSDGGEGNKVAILGIDSRLINVELNGNALATSTVGVDDPDSGRSFNFTNLAPEIIGTVEVYKSTQAKLDEGAVGGTILVNTRNPLDLPANTASLSGNYNYNLRTDSGNPRGSAFYSWRNESDTFGVLGTVAYNKLELGGTSFSVLSGYQTACNVPEFGGCTTAGAFSDPSKLPKVTSGPALTPGTLVPENFDSGSFIQTEERLTFQGALVWRPTHDIELNLTGYAVNGDDSSYSQALISDVGVDYDDRNGYSAVNAAGATNFPLTFTSVTTNGNGVTGATLAHLTERLDLQYNKQELDTRSGNLQAKWTPGPWSIELNAGITSATGGVNPQYFLSFYGHTSGSYSLSGNSANLNTADPVTDPTLFQSRATGQQAGFVKYANSIDNIEYAKIDFRRNVDWFDWINKIEFGYRYVEHTNKDNSHFYNTNVKQVGDLSDFSYLTTSPSTASGIGLSGDLLSYAYLRQADVVSYSENNRNPGSSAGNPTKDFTNTGADYFTREKDNAGYFQADFRHGRFHGDAGVRVVHTENDETYFTSQNYYPYIGDFASAKNEYTDVLPAFNLVYDLAEKQDLRFTVAKVMSRPSFADESGQTTYNVQTRTGSGGNPNLGPYRATNYGASYEFYFAKNSLFTADFFFRDVSEYTIYRNVLTSLTLPQATVDYCNEPVPATNGGIPACPGLPNPVDILLTTPYNGSNAKVKGISLDYQGDLKWGFGIQTNVTWLDQDFGTLTQAQSVTGSNGGTAVTTTVTNDNEKYPLPFLSKWSYTIAPYYERGPLQIHLSYTWRSKYNSVSGSIDSTPAYTASFGEMDGSLIYTFAHNLELTIAAANILDPLVKPFTTSNLPLGFSKYGTRISAGITYRFH